jgi:SAM-dependent methyltransferase
MKRGIPLRRCGCCGTLFAQVPQDREPPPSLYDSLYAGEESAPQAIRRTIEEWVMAAAPYRLTGRWLDVGYGAGGLLAAATEHGWEAYGTEASAVALALGRQRGWRVAASSEELGCPAQSFDVISLVELLEHLPDPGAMLGRAAALLRPGGLAFITTPNARSLNCRLLGHRWAVVAPPDHRVLFTRKGLSSLLQRHGLAAFAIRTSGFNPSDIMRLMSRRAQNVDRVAVGRAVLTAADASPMRRSIKRVLNALLDQTRMGDTLKVWAQQAQ